MQESVRIENAIDGTKLFEEISQWVAKHEDLETIHEKQELERPLKALCTRYSKLPILQQMLTVLSMDLPGDYEKGCFCAWISLAISKQRKLSPEQTEAAFLAGLSGAAPETFVQSIIFDPSRRGPPSRGSRHGRSSPLDVTLCRSISDRGASARCVTAENGSRDDVAS